MPSWRISQAMRMLALPVKTHQQEELALVRGRRGEEGLRQAAQQERGAEPDAGQQQEQTPDVGCGHSHLPWLARRPNGLLADALFAL